MSNPIAVEMMHGVRTRWETVTYGDDSNDLKERDKRASVVPNLGNLWLAQWGLELQKHGANIAELNIEPRIHIGNQPVLAYDDLQKYKVAYYVPFCKRTPDQQEEVQAARDCIMAARYTVTQRNDLLLGFLERLNGLWIDGKLGAYDPDGPPPFQFLLHQRQYVCMSDPERVDHFVADIGGFINSAKEAGLDRWLAGVRLGEHNNADMSDFLNVVWLLARDLNVKTTDAQCPNGWLKDRLFLANGGGMGAEYKGIHNTGFDFFRLIALQTGAFAFGYKWMKYPNDTKTINTISEWMAQATDGGAREHHQYTKEEWKRYLEEDLGFNDLRRFINYNRRLDPNDPNHKHYLRHAHVVFVGDSSDSLNLLTRENNDTLEDRPALAAIRELFEEAKGPTGQYADGWNGKHFCQFITTAEGNADSSLVLAYDKGFSLYDGIASRGTVAVVHPRTLAKWKEWPVSP